MALCLSCGHTGNTWPRHPPPPNLAITSPPTATPLPPPALSAPSPNPTADQSPSPSITPPSGPLLPVPYPFSASGCTSPPEQQPGLVPFTTYFGAAVLASLTPTTILEVRTGDSVLLDVAPSVQFGALVVKPGARLVVKDSTCLSAAVSVPLQ